jgi:hypothetical protein
MGKVFVEFGIPLIVIVAVAWFIIKKWFINVLPAHIRTVKEIDKAAEKFDAELGLKEKNKDVHNG